MRKDKILDILDIDKGVVGVHINMKRITVEVSRQPAELSAGDLATVLIREEYIHDYIHKALTDRIRSVMVRTDYAANEGISRYDYRYAEYLWGRNYREIYKKVREELYEELYKKVREELYEENREELFNLSILDRLKLLVGRYDKK